LSTDKEHNSNLIPASVGQEKGIRHEIVRSSDDGSFDLEKFKEAVKGVKMVAMVHT
jgi:selenocysteine lyase/cysteine desulfurase